MFQLLRHQMNNGIFRSRIYFGCVGVFYATDIAREFNCGKLHAVAQTEIWNFFLARVLYSPDFSLHSAAAESTRDYNAVKIIKLFQFALVVFVDFGVEPLYLRLAAIGDRSMANGFYDGNIRIGKCELAAAEAFSNDGYFQWRRA